MPQWMRRSLPRASPGRRMAPSGARDGETVLLVETTTSRSGKLGVSALGNLGYRVLAASDGRAALALLDAAEASRVDLLFTDVVLPGGMSGPELAVAAVARRPGLSVLFTSGYTRNAMAQGSAASSRCARAQETLCAPESRARDPSRHRRGRKRCRLGAVALGSAPSRRRWG